MRSLLIFFGSFAAVGTICFVIMCITIYSTMQRNATWVESKGVITGLSEYPTVTFDYYGQEMQFRSSFSSSDMQTGDEVTVYFPPDHPEEAEIKSFFTQWFLPMFMSVFAFVFGGIGFFGVGKQIKRLNAKRDLFTYGKGRKTTLPVSKVIPDTSFKVNGRSPYMIICQFHDAVSNKMYEFKSDYIWYDPADLLKDRNEIDIYVDPNDLTYYYMDTSFLPKKA